MKNIKTIKVRKRMTIVLAIVLLCGILLFINNKYGITSGSSSQLSETKTINTSLSELKSQFDKMKNKAKWDMNKPLYWGYYFYDKDQEKLQKFSVILQEEGLKTYNVRKSEDLSSNSYLLYSFENNVQTPKSLLEKCYKLSQLAKDNHIEVFDGWEAGEKPL
jgi:hypothetical protein